MGLVALLKKWFPGEPDRAGVEAALDAFYAGHAGYHAMIAGPGKGTSPQAEILMCLVEDGRTYADIGCGSGEVAARVAASATVVGVDAASMAVREAERRCAGLNARFIVGRADALPLKTESVDGTYAFELLEHVWEPADVLREMVRVTKPGGFVLVSAPLFMALDLHRRKRPLARLTENTCAGVRLALDMLSGCTCHHMRPKLDGPVYPDCDVVSAIVPRALVRTLDDAGCQIEFWDTTYMCAHRGGSKTDLIFQRKNGHILYRHFGDHLILLGRKCGERRADGTQ